MNKNENRPTLANQIKWVIGNRIMLCLALLSITVFISSGYDVYVGFQQIKKSLDNDSRVLGEYIVAQSLIENKDGINIKLDELNRDNRLKKFEWNPRQAIQKMPVLNWNALTSWIYLYPVRGRDGEGYGELKITGSILSDNSILIQLITKFILLVTFSFMIFVLLYPLSKRIPQELFVAPIVNLLALFKRRGDVIDNDIVLAQELQEVQSKVVELISDVTKYTREAALGQMAAQVAHDIRSPLVALDIVVKDILSIPEEQRILIRSATSRIRDIANNLLSHHRKNVVSQKVDEKAPELISELVLSVVSEKRIQYNDNVCDISIYVQEAVNTVFVNISAINFKRVLSNLLNNAIESMQHSALKTISITLVSQADNVVISIQDQGCGMESDFLSRVMAGEVVSQKASGNGLGLSYTKKMVEDVWGGKLLITSQLNIGTTISIQLPETPKPSWFANKIIFSSNSVIVILDDDEAIHQVWLNRFGSISSQVKIIKFYNIYNFLDWVKDNDLSNCLFLIDYELIGSSMNGLEIIEHLKIAAMSYLVTSRYEEMAIREKCNDIKIKMIPKNCAASISILMESNDLLHPDLVFIDDSKILTQAWSMRANLLNKNIIVFNSVDEFMASNVFLICNKTIPLYIDSDLGHDLSGQEMARHLYERGFDNIYLSTGYDVNRFEEMYWIKAIVGKDPPF